MVQGNRCSIPKRPSTRVTPDKDYEWNVAKRRYGLGEEKEQRAEARRRAHAARQEVVKAENVGVDYPRDAVSGQSPMKKREPVRVSGNSRVDVWWPYDFGIVVEDFDPSAFGDGYIFLGKGDIVQFLTEEGGWWFGQRVSVKNFSVILARGWYPPTFTVPYSGQLAYADLQEEMRVQAHAVRQEAKKTELYFCSSVSARVPLTEEPARESGNNRVDVSLPYEFGLVIADFDASAHGEGYLNLWKGDVIKVVTEEGGWWLGQRVSPPKFSVKLEQGWYPPAYTVPYTDQSASVDSPFTVRLDSLETMAGSSGRPPGANANVAPSQDPPPTAPSFQHTPPTGSMPLGLMIREGSAPPEHLQISKALTYMIRRKYDDEWVPFVVLIHASRLREFSPQDVFDTIQTEYDRRRGLRFSTYWEWEGNAVIDISVSMNENFHSNRYGR